MIEIIPTVVPKVLDDVTAARERYAPFVSSLHVDIVDGVFAPNKTWIIGPGEKLPDHAATHYELHLMVSNPLQVGLAFARAGARRIIGHVEAFDNADCAREAFDMWQKAGAKESGLAILHTTPLEELVMYASLCDFVHIMTISTIGKQGAPFEPTSLDRVREVHKRYPKMIISVDGGENSEHVAELSKVGASRFAVGSALAKAKDVSKEFAKLQAA